MDHETEKARQILAEVIGYFLDSGIHGMQVSFEPSLDGFRIAVSGPSPREPADFGAFRQALSDGFQPELEEYYLQLLDMRPGKEHHHLLGAIVDEAEAEYAQGILTVKVFKRGTGSGVRG